MPTKKASRRTPFLLDSKQLFLNPGFSTLIQLGENGRGKGIRTPDILLPKQARYRTALYPDDAKKHLVKGAFYLDDACGITP
jgi:hypothetical protein